MTTAMLNGDSRRIDDSMIRRVIRKPFDIDAVMKALIETAAELAAGHEMESLPPVIKQIVPGDAGEHADAPESPSDAQPAGEGAQGHPDKPV